MHGREDEHVVGALQRVRAVGQPERVEHRHPGGAKRVQAAHSGSDRVLQHRFGSGSERPEQSPVAIPGAWCDFLGDQGGLLAPRAVVGGLRGAGGAARRRLDGRRLVAARRVEIRVPAAALQDEAGASGGQHDRRAVVAVSGSAPSAQSRGIGGHRHSRHQASDDVIRPQPRHDCLRRGNHAVREHRHGQALDVVREHVVTARKSCRRTCGAHQLQRGAG